MGVDRMSLPPDDSIGTRAKLKAELEEAERKAIQALAGYKFQMFSYWAGVWVHLNRIGQFKLPNPFRDFVLLARQKRRQFGKSINKATG